MPQPAKSATSAQIIIPARSLQEDIPFFTEVLGMRMESIFPAEDPSVAVFFGHGIRVRIEKMKDGEENTVPVRILLFCDDPSDFFHGDAEHSKVLFLCESELKL